MRYLFLLRHGNTGQELEGHRCIGHTDLSLSEYGKRQIEKSKEYIRSFSWKKVYVSPLNRCVETAECLGISKNQMNLKEGLKEMKTGIWENLTFSEIKEKYPKLYEERGKNLGTFAVEGGESFLEAGLRFEQCLKEIREETKDDVLIIAHAGVIRAFLCLMRDQDMNRVMDYAIPYGSLTVLKEENEKLEAVDWGIRPEELIDEEEIDRIYKKCKTPENVIFHMRKVAEAAECLMKEEGEEDRRLVRQAALLHDILRTEKNHSKKAGEFLRREGYKKAAALVELHDSPDFYKSEAVKLDEVLFYADKRVLNDTIVSVKKRFEISEEKCKGNMIAREKHKKLYEKTIRIETKLKEAGRNLEF